MVDVASTPVLGLKTCQELGLVQWILAVSDPVTKPDLFTEYSDVFKGLGDLGVVHKIKLQDDAVPVIHAPRRVPEALMESLREELDHMLSLGVIQNVETPT